MRRRSFVKSLGAAAIAAPWPALGQKTPPIVAVLVPGPLRLANDRIVVIRKGLQEAGLSEGVHYTFALRYADGVFERLPGLSLELAALKPSVLIASAAAALVAHKTVPDLPLVFTSYAGDPIRAGFAESFVHPGGHATGNVMNAVGGEEALTQKRMTFFREMVPDFKRLGFIGADSILATAEVDALQRISSQFGFEIVRQPIHGLDDVEEAVAGCIRAGADALYVSGQPLLYNNIGRVLPLVLLAWKPTVGTYPEWGQAGLLMSYSADLLDDFRRAGIYAAKILGGEKPGDLPIEQASKFVLVINRKTANVLGIELPPSLVALADEVVE
jgi:putative ABC transport system substrate-binding protein